MEFNCEVCNKQSADTEIFIMRKNDFGPTGVVGICKKCLSELKDLSTNNGNESIRIIDRNNQEDSFCLCKGTYFNWRNLLYDSFWDDHCGICMKTHDECDCSETGRR